MHTLNELTKDTIRILYGYSQIIPRRLSLKKPLSNTDTEVYLSEPSGFARSVFEIDEELCYATTFDEGKGAAILEPWGRGFDGTVAVAHDEGAMVTMDPQWSIKAVRDELVNQIRGVYPDLWATRATSAVASEGRPIPAVGRVIDVFTDEQGEIPRRLSRFDSNEGALYVRGIADNTPLRVYSAVLPDIPQPDEDVCRSSGLPEGSEVVIQLGALAKFITGVTIALTQSNDVEQSDREGFVSISSTTGLQRSFIQQRQLEIARIRDAMFETRPLRPHHI